MGFVSDAKARAKNHPFLPRKHALRATDQAVVLAVEVRGARWMGEHHAMHVLGAAMISDSNYLIRRGKLV